MDDEGQYKAFLDELQALERFRMSYVAEHPGTPLAPDDPDVRRLIEALAFFSVRSQRAALNTLADQRCRLFRQFLPHLLEPLPAMGMLSALPTSLLSEVVELPRGTELALRDPGDRVAVFRTLRALRLMPLAPGKLTMLQLADGRLRLALPMTTTHPRSDAVGTLSFHVNYLNDFNTSLKVLHALQHNLDRVSVSFADRVDENTTGERCNLSFGGGEEADDDCAHPLARERAYFHFPRVEHFFEVTVPATPARWTQFTLLFDLGPEWPRHLRLTSEVFQLFTTPIVNLVRAPAQPILHDGTKERWPLRHPTPAARFELHSLRGVYHLSGEALVPLPPAAIAGARGAYELEDRPRGDQRQPALLLHLPEALGAPVTVSAEAEWLQRWFSGAIGQRLRIAPYRRAAGGVQWELSGELVPHRDAQLGKDSDDFTHILVLQHKRRLDRDDLDALLETLGSVWTGPFAPLHALITGVRVHEAPARRGAAGDGSAVVYELVLAEHEPDLTPLVETFARHLSRVLSAWTADGAVIVRLAAQP